MLAYFTEICRNILSFFKTGQRYRHFTQRPISFIGVTIVVVDSSPY